VRFVNKSLVVLADACTALDIIKSLPLFIKRERESVRGGWGDGVFPTGACNRCPMNHHASFMRDPFAVQLASRKKGKRKARGIGREAD
jgi:hypothetical protein